MRPASAQATTRARRSLNAIIIASGGLLALAPVAAVSGIAAFTLCAFGITPIAGQAADGAGLAAIEAAPALATPPSMPGAWFPAWAVISLAAFALGSLLAMRRRLDNKKAAKWLDDRLGTRELFSALLELEGNAKVGSRFGAEIRERAEHEARRARNPGFPLRVIAMRGAAALAACLAFGALVGTADPARPAFSAASLAAHTEASRLLPGFAQRAQALPESQAAALANYLFPQDLASAELAERALREGRVTDFRNLLDKAAKDLGDRIPRAVNDRERKRLLDEKAKLDEAAAATMEGTESASSAPGDQGGGDLSPGQGDLGRGDGGSGGGNPGQGGGKRGGSLPDGGDALPQDKGGGGRKEGGAGGGDGGSPTVPSGPRDRQGDQGGPGAGQQGQDLQGGGQSNKNGMGGGAGSGAGGSNPPTQSPDSIGGNTAGSGSGTARDWGKLTARAAGKVFTVAPDRTTPFFDYVLKGKDPSGGPAGIAGRAAKAAESAISAEDLPFEYEDFVKSYYLALSHIVSEEAGEDGQEQGAAR